MICSLTGVVAGFGSSAVELEVGGVGYFVSVPTPVLAELKVGQKLRLLTHMVVREDAMSLFGFTAPQQRELFLLLIAISGVGPKLALSLLGSFEPDALRRIVQDGDVASLTSVPGIGKRGAERIIVELKERLGPVIDGGPGGHSKLAEVRDALLGLGYSPVELRGVLDGLSTDEARVEELVKSALKQLAGLGNR